MTITKIKGVINLPNNKPETVVAKLDTVVKSMTGNPLFANADPPIAVLQGQYDLINQLISQRNMLERQLAAVKEQLKHETNKSTYLLTETCNYVEKIARAENNASLLLSAGFSLQGDNKSSVAVDVPENVRLIEIKNTSGLLQVLFNKVDNAKAYGVVFVYSEVFPVSYPEQAQHIVSSTRNIRIKLDKGKTVWVRVKAFGTHNTESDWSDPATRIVP